MRAWVDEIPEEELASHYAKAVADLDENDLSMLAAWHASMEVGTPVANKDFLVAAFGSLGENRREALKIAAGLRGEDAFNAGFAEDQALDMVLPWLSHERAASSPPSASSSTAGTGWAARTNGLGSDGAADLRERRRERRLQLADERRVPASRLLQARGRAAPSATRRRCRSCP